MPISPRKRWFPPLTIEEVREEHWPSFRSLLTAAARKAFRKAGRWTFTKGGLPAVVAEYRGDAFAIAFERNGEGRVVGIDIGARR